MGTHAREPRLFDGCRPVERRQVPWRHWPPPERVAIDLDVNCLRRLLGARQLHVENFSCADGRSQECVRRLLLQNLVSGD